MVLIEHQIKMLQEFIREDIYKYCKKYIGEEEEEVLRGIIQPQVAEWLASESALFRRDKRTEIDFAKALVVDKIILHWLLQYFAVYEGRKWFLNGCDKTDTLIAKNGIDYSPDIITLKGVYIEEVTSYTGFVKATGAIHLRDDKGIALKELAKTQKVYLLIIDIPTRSYCMKEIKEDTPLFFIPKLNSFGGKSAWGMDIDPTSFKAFKDINSVKEDKVA